MSRRRRAVPLACVLALAAGAGWAQGVGPVTYVLDYGNQHLGNAQWLADTLSAPPQVLHLGKDLVMSHNWGPIQGLGGENQAGGKGEAVRRLTPAQTRKRYADLKAMVAALHAGGVQIVMPYICTMTIGGDPEKRTGFWEFYDHWDEYAEFGLGPRPADDPRTWFQVYPDGSPHYFYALTDGKYPPYEPNVRYACCVNNPNWRAWSEQVVRLCAEVGYDGVFPDNGGSQKCYCGYCQAKFREWLKGRYTPEQLRDLCGAVAEDLTLATGIKQGLLWVETERFWSHSLTEHHLALRATGERVRKPFYVFPNGAESRPGQVRTMFRPLDFMMFERTTGEWGTHPGMVQHRILGDIRLRVINDNIHELKLTECEGGKQCPMVLTRAGFPRTNPDWELNAQTAELGMAEAAAFGRGGFLVRPEYGEMGAALRKYRAFFENHGDLYKDARSHAQVAVACFAEQRSYGNAVHLQQVKALGRALSECHLLYDYVPEEGFTAQNLQRYRLVILAEVRAMSREQVAAVMDYLRAGGKVLLMGRNAEMDELARPYERPVLWVESEAAGEPVAVGKGVAATLPTVPDSPGLQSALASLGAGGTALMPREADRRVAFNAYRSADGRRLLLHALNYDVPLGCEAKAVQAREDVTVRLPLPTGTKAVRATVYDPDREPQALAVASDGPDAVRLALPALRVYQVVAVELEP